MSTIAALADQFAGIQSGDPWYGASIERVLAGLTATEAAARPVSGAHSIWELVLHLTAWVREVDRRLAKGGWQNPAEGDWPAVPEATAANWSQAVRALEKAHTDLGATLGGLSPERLGVRVGSERDPAAGTGVTCEEMLQGLLQHDAYHLGQISLLKKAIGTRR
jgi:uncharacterized damage-inducible protein DinB